MNLEMMLFKAKNWLMGSTKTEEKNYRSLQELLKKLPFRRAHVRVHLPGLRINTTLEYDLMASILEENLPEEPFSDFSAELVTYETNRLKKEGSGYKTVTSRRTRVVINYLNLLQSPPHLKAKVIIDYTTQQN